MIARVRTFLRNNERNVMLVISFTCVFLLGFFAGKLDSINSDPPVITIEKSNDNFSVLNDQTQPQELSNVGNDTQVLGNASDNTGCAPGQIKGNISSSGRIYHIPGGAFYNRTDPEMCFNTEAEAQAAGFRRSQR